jgi:hypothetical protein
MAKRKINLGGQEFMADEVEFESESSEKWNSYILHDGTTLKLKVVLADVLRVEDQCNGHRMATPSIRVLFRRGLN